MCISFFCFSKSYVSRDSLKQRKDFLSRKCERMEHVYFEQSVSASNWLSFCCTYIQNNFLIIDLITELCFLQLG